MRLHWIRVDPKSNLCPYKKATWRHRHKKNSSVTKAAFLHARLWLHTIQETGSPGAFFWSINPPRSNSRSSAYTLLCQGKPFLISSQKPLLNQKDLLGFLQGHSHQRSAPRLKPFAHGLIILMASPWHTGTMPKLSEINSADWV